VSDQFINDLFEKSRLKLKSEYEQIIAQIEESLQTDKREALKKIKSFS